MNKIIFLFALAVMMSCQQEPKTEVFWISEGTTPCVSDTNRKCYQITKNEKPSGDWEELTIPFSNFEFDRGIYKKVEVKRVKPIREIEQDYVYEIVSVLDSLKTNRYLLGGEWEMTERFDLAINVNEDEKQPPLLQINSLNMDYSGSTGCNEFSGIVDRITEQDLNFGMTISSRNECENKLQESEVLRIIQFTASYFVNENQLELFNPDKKRIAMFKRK